VNDKTSRQVKIYKVRNGDVKLHVSVSGEGMPVLLLHGFPENHQSWRHQVAPLVEAGYSSWTPDLRGYGLSDIPSGKKAYSLANLVSDVAAIAKCTGCPRLHVVGHDWGGVIAWQVAAEHPDIVASLTIMNAPHLQIYKEKLWRSRQWLRSAYIAFFLLPFLPERWLSKNGFANLRRIFLHSPVRKGSFSEEDAEGYVQALSRPGSLTAALNYYRANLAFPIKPSKPVTVTVPALIVWGEQDAALDLSLLDGIDRFCSQSEIRRIADAGHWVQNEAPEEVSRALLDFLKRQEKTLPAI
jgi:pimeloyl-ACP methyl ester carboxylesterase